MSGLLQSGKITHRHHRVALLAAGGLKPSEIASSTGFSLHTVREFLRHPLMQDLVTQYRVQFSQSTMAQLNESILMDGPATLKRLQQIRDNADDEIAIKACIPLFDRQAPKRTIHEEDRTVRFVFEEKERARVQSVLNEVRQIEDAEVVDGAASTHAAD